MGLDLGIVKRRRGPAYEACEWEDVCWWRNCWEARDIILNSISTYSKEDCEAVLTIGAIQGMLKNLIAGADSYSLNDLAKIDTDALAKVYRCIGDLGKLLADDIWNYEFNSDIRWDYKLIDSY